MRVLLSTIGTRGDVQPLLAVALELKALKQEVRLCAPPDFTEWINGFGIAAVPIGPNLRALTSTQRATGVRPSPEQLRQLAKESLDTQFTTVTAAAQGCDVLVAGGALQVAAHSVAEARRIQYVYASYCPVTLPSPYHAPLPLPSRAEAPPADPATDNRTLWARDAQRWNEMWGGMLNAHRKSAGLPPVDDVRDHIFTNQPWLAADPTLAPWPEPGDPHVFQPGAWILSDQRPLAPELQAFLEAGEPPIYFGFGTMGVTEELAQMMIQSARALGRRAIVFGGWTDLSLVDDGIDWISIGDVDQQELFPRVAAVVHHGGAGTTTTTARAGAPQVVVPQMYDQHYWARQIDRLGLGCVHPRVTPTADSLAAALSGALDPDVAARARTIAAAIRTDGASTAAQRLIRSYSGSS